MVKLLKSLTPGATLVVPGSKHNGVAPVLRKLADDHHATGTTLLDTRDIIDLIAIDGKEPTNSDIVRRANGNNNYGVSNIRKYLNSVGPNWYTPQHAQDTPPNASNVWEGHGPYDKRNGFLSAFPSEFVDRITTTTLTTVVPDVDGGGVSTQKDKVFLLSRTEVGLGDERETEGKVIPFFKDNTARLKKPTQQALDNTTYTATGLTVSKPWRWWLRSPNAAVGYNVRRVYSDGTLYYSGAYDGESGAAPALNLPSDTLVSDAPNAQGHYEIMLNNPPTITLDVQQNQVYYEGSTLNIAGKAKDTDVNDAVIVKYKIGSANERILTTQASQGKEFDYGKVLTFTKSRFYDGETPVSDVLLAGNTYQLQVWAQDDKGAKSAIETRNFTVVPNRKPLIHVTELPTLEGGTGITELSIKGTVNDPDGDDVTLTYKLNDGKETPLVVVEEAFEIDFTVEQLRVGVNNFTIIARDEYEALTTATVQINVNKVSGGTEHIKKVVVFDIDMQGKETDGAVLWIRRPFTDDTNYTASISTVEPDAVESYKGMDKVTQVVQGHNRDQFTGKSDTKGSKVSIKLDIEGEGNVTMIQGVIK